MTAMWYWLMMFSCVVEWAAIFFLNAQTLCALARIGLKPRRRNAPFGPDSGCITSDLSP